MCLQLVGLPIYLGGTSTQRISHLTVYFFTFVKLWTKFMVTEGHCVSSTLQRRHGKTIGIDFLTDKDQSDQYYLLSYVAMSKLKKVGCFSCYLLTGCQASTGKWQKAFIMSSCPLNFQTLLKLQFKTLLRPLKKATKNISRFCFSTYCSCMAKNVEESFHLQSA